MKQLLAVFVFISLNSLGDVLHTPHTISELLTEPYLDDYYSNVIYGYNIVTETQKYAGRYSGNSLKCTNCHLDSGTKTDALPLNVYGMYPKWRSKNHQRNGIELRIRECFLYSLNGIMPPDDSPEVLAVSAYIFYLSHGEVVGKAPIGRGVPTLQDTGYDPNPATGRLTYAKRCSSCHGENGAGIADAPPLWGMDSYNAGAGMRNVDKAAGFIWANMPLGDGKSLTPQEAKDVAAYINSQYRPEDPRESKLLKLIEKFWKIPVWLEELIWT